MRRIIGYLINVIIIIDSLFFDSCTNKYYDEKGNVFGTIYDIKYQSKHLMTTKIDSVFQVLNLSVNPFIPNSIISKVNRNEDVEVDDHFTILFNKSLEVSEKSEGFFDVTCAPLINLWGFGFEKSDSISPQIVDSIRVFVGYKKIRLHNNKVIKDDPRIELNFSAIAKGYACDLISEMFEREGINNYMIWIGGEVVTKGKNPNNDCWHMGIKRPPKNDKDIKNIMIDNTEDIVLVCTKKGMATSGDYRNFYIKNGKRYAHTINPKTGYPAGQSLLSVTIIADDCMTADVYATACMAMGTNAAVEMLKEMPELEYYLIYPDENNHSEFKKSMSSGLKNMIKLEFE